MASLYKHMGKLQSAVAWILRRKSKFPKVKSLVLTHSACTCKNYVPKCFQTPCESIFFLHEGADTLSIKKNIRKTYIVHLHCIVEPYNASRLPILQFWLYRVKLVMSCLYACVGGKHCKCMASLYEHMGKTSKGCNFNFKAWIKSLVSTYSACPCKKLCPQIFMLPNPPRIRSFI